MTHLTPSPQWYAENASPLVAMGQSGSVSGMTNSAAAMRLVTRGASMSTTTTEEGVAVYEDFRVWMVGRGMPLQSACDQLTWRGYSLYDFAVSGSRYVLTAALTDAGQIYCNSTWDSVTCWPTTQAGRLAEVACPTMVDGIEYDNMQNATRMCFANGTWQEKSNYSRCVPVRQIDDENSLHNFITRIIYYVGFTTSLIALIIALSIFLYFRSLRCLRNTIHCHLIVTFIIRNVLWMIMNFQLMQVNHNPESSAWEWVCKFTMTIYNYIQVTNFFWMLVEGLYLHTMIVWAFSVEKIKFWYYGVLGWGVPGVFIIIWAAIKAKFENKSCWLPMDDTYYDFIYIVPILLVLIINLFFLGSIVYVMITKLRAHNNTLQTRHSSEPNGVRRKSSGNTETIYRKAVRATLILFPLLGVTYVLFITPPTDDVVSKNIFVYFNAVLQSTQGLMVSIFYCFMNGEVRSAIKQKIDRYHDSRSITLRYTRASIVGANTEQICLNSKSPSNTENGRIGSASNLTRSTRSSQDYTIGGGTTSGSCGGKDDNLNQVEAPMLKDEAL